MEVQKDFRDVLGLFNKHEINFILNKRPLGRKKDIADLKAVGKE
jgi:hypothetical protein